MCNSWFRIGGAARAGSRGHQAAGVVRADEQPHPAEEGDPRLHRYALTPLADPAVEQGEVLDESDGDMVADGDRAVWSHLRSVPCAQPSGMTQMTPPDWVFQVGEEARSPPRGHGARGALRSVGEVGRG